MMTIGIRLIAATAMILGLFGLPGCDSASTAGQQQPRQRASGEKYRVVCTVGMVADIVREVVGEQAEVQGIIGEGVDPHLYSPTRNDIAALQSADVIFYSGLMLEGKMADALVKVARTGKPVYAVTEEIEASYLLEPPGAVGHADPHVWMDVKAWSQATRVVADALGTYDSKHAPVYRDNAERYRAELAKLDTYAKSVIASIPREQRVLVTAHDAFNYFGRAYGIAVQGIQGISTESEAGLQDIRRLIDYIVEKRVRAVFVETSVADKNVRALIEGAEARGHSLVIGGSLFSDAMGKPGTYEGTYLGMIDHNATTIARALGGEAPTGGMQGKLTGGE